MGGEWSAPRSGHFTRGKAPLGPSWAVAPQKEIICGPSTLIITNIYTYEGKKHTLFSALLNY
jgi:hypothetical protein